jgi:G3E family GTPase
MDDGGTRLRLSIIGGYLGAGKTTWLRHQLHEGQFGNAPHVIVNEAARAAVDDALLSGCAGLSLIAGGCACCDTRADLLAVLRTLCDERSAGRGPDHAVLETSGLADPAAIARGIASDPVLSRHLRLDQMVVTVDALHGTLQLEDDPLWRVQVAAADRLVITKADIAPSPALRQLRAVLARLNPGATIEGAAQGVPASLPDARPDADPPMPADMSGKARLQAIELPLPSADWAIFSLWLSALLHARGDDIVRCKGVIATPAGRLLLQAVRTVVQPPEILPEVANGTSDNVLVLFGRGVSAADLSRSLARFLR